MTIQQQIDNLIIQIKQQPMGLDERLALIQYYCLDGNWPQAKRSVEQFLKIHQEQQIKLLLLNNICCEQQRLAVLNHSERIKIYANLNTEFSDNQQQIFQQIYLNPNGSKLQDQFLKTCSLAEQRYAMSLNHEQVINGFWIDTDIRYAFIIEIFVIDQYFWLPLDVIESLKFKENQFITDLVWRRAEIRLKDGAQLACFIPARYPIILDEAISDALKYAKETIWREYDGLSIAQGQKTFSNGLSDVGILDIHRLDYRQ